MPKPPAATTTTGAQASARLEPPAGRPAAAVSEAATSATPDEVPRHGPAGGDRARGADPQCGDRALLGKAPDGSRAGEQQRLAPDLGPVGFRSDDGDGGEAAAAGEPVSRVDQVVDPATAELPAAKPRRRRGARHAPQAEHGDERAAEGVVDPDVPGRRAVGGPRQLAVAAGRDDVVGDPAPAQQLARPPDGEPFADPAEVDRVPAEADLTGCAAKARPPRPERPSRLRRPRLADGHLPVAERE